jgi:tRNA(His) 5'-end guanylyltransferase
MSHYSDFEIRMKDYEKLYTSLKCMPQLPVFARIDGRSFHTWTSDLKRPYDERLSKLFVDTTKFLLEETGAKIGYTQSDEITLCWFFEDYKSQLFFDGKIHKLNSVVASLATGYFNKEVENSPENGSQDFIPIKYVDGESGLTHRSLAFFDCRTWQVPNLDEAANVFLWREQDATRNSITMAAQSVYSHKELHEKSTKQMQEMLHGKGINWNNYPSFFKKGTYLTRQKDEHFIPLGNNEESIYVDRTVIKELEMPPFGRIENRVGVLFKGESIILREDKIKESIQKARDSGAYDVAEHLASMVVGEPLDDGDKDNEH